MKKIKFFTIILSLGIVLSACNNTQKGAGIGAGGGALLGRSEEHTSELQSPQ